MLSHILCMVIVLCGVVSIHSLSCPASCPLLATPAGESSCCSLGSGEAGCGMCASDTCAGNELLSCQEYYGSKCIIDSTSCFVDSNDVPPGKSRLGVVVGRSCPWAGVVVICSNSAGECKPVDSDHVCAQYPLTYEHDDNNNEYYYYAEEVADIPCQHSHAKNAISGAMLDEDDEYIGTYQQDDMRGRGDDTTDDMDLGDDTTIDDVYPVEDKVFDGGDDATRPDDDHDPTQAGDDAFDSALFIDPPTEDVDLDAVNKMADRSISDAAASAGDQPCGNSLRGGAHPHDLTTSVEDFFVLSASSAVKNFLRGSVRASS